MFNMYFLCYKLVLNLLFIKLGNINQIKHVEMGCFFEVV